MTPYSQILQEELSKRCTRNPRYSLRAFAKSLGVDPGALSRILAQKQIPSLKVANSILEALDLPLEKKRKFIQSIALTQKKRPLKRLNSFFEDTKGTAPLDIENDSFEEMAEWHFAAILELTTVESFESTPEWMARALELPLSTVKLAIERLVKLGLLKQVDGKLKRVVGQITTKQKNKTSHALRSNQRQFLEKALASLDVDPIDERSMTSITMSIDPRQLALAKTLIHEFNQKLCRLLEEGRRKRVYSLTVALFPLQKSNSSKRRSNS